MIGGVWVTVRLIPSRATSLRIYNGAWPGEPNPEYNDNRDGRDGMGVRAAGLSILSAVLATSAIAGPKVAVMPFDLADQTAEAALTSDPYLVLSAPKVSPEEQQRLALAKDELTRLLAERLGYEPVDLSGLAGEIKQAAPFYKCDGCEVEIARKAGAELVVSGNIQKLSALILNLNMMMRDVASGDVRAMQTVPLRDNSDDGWLRGVRKVIEHQLAAEKGGDK